MAKARKGQGIRLFLQFLLILLLTLFLVGTLVFEMARTKAALRRETATVCTVTETVTATGYVFRDETVVESLDGGPIVYAVENGALVAAGDALALVYADGSNTGTRTMAAELTAEIERLQALDDPTRLPDYYGAYEALMASLSAGTVLGTEASTDTLCEALDLYAAQKEEASARAAKIATLQAEFEKLIENDLNATDRVSAPVAGVFQRDADGYEAVLSTAAIETLTPGGLRALLISPQDTVLAVGKIQTRGTWYLAVPYDGAAAAAFEEDKAYGLSFTRTGEAMTLTLSRITTADTEGEVLLIFRADGLAPPADLARSEEVVISVEARTGILVPITALREEDGAYGVYVEENGVAAYRKIEPLFMREGCCLAAVSAEIGYLQEGERILVTPRRIYDGKALE